MTERYFDLCLCSLYNMIHKEYQCQLIKRYWRYYPQWKSALWNSIKVLFLLPKFANISPSVNRHKKICQVTWLWGDDVTSSWVGVPIETLRIRFTCCPNLMFPSSSWLEVYRFSHWSYCYFEKFKIDSRFDGFGQVKIVPTHSLWLALGRSQFYSYFNELG